MFIYAQLKPSLVTFHAGNGKGGQALMAFACIMLNIKKLLREARPQIGTWRQVGRVAASLGGCGNRYESSDGRTVPALCAHPAASLACLAAPALSDPYLQIHQALLVLGSNHEQRLDSCLKAAACQ